MLFGIARHELQPDWDQQVAPLDTVRAALGEQVARTREPAAGLSQLSREDHAVPEPEREPDCPRHILPLECFTVAALQQVVALRLLADEVSSDRMTLDIVEGQRR